MVAVWFTGGKLALAIWGKSDDLRYWRWFCVGGDFQLPGKNPMAISFVCSEAVTLGYTKPDRISFILENPVPICIGDT